MTILVVGGSGYLGGAICAALAEHGHEVMALSRGGGSGSGSGSGWSVRGDVTRHNLGLEASAMAAVRSGVTHIVSTFGSVDWAAGPSTAVDVHASGVRNLLRLARSCERLEGLVHISSLLALGRAGGVVGNRELYLGQTFRNWYEYGKYYAESLVRAADDVPHTVLRFGPLLGADPARPLSARDGLLACVPYLLQGYPIHLERGGDFPCYVGEVTTAANVVRRAVESPSTGATWSWFDPTLPSLATVLHRLCRPYGRVPRIVDAGRLGRLQRWVAPRVGVPEALLDYTAPWFELDPDVLLDVPGGPPRCPPGYLEDTGRALRHPASDLTGVFA